MSTSLWLVFLQEIGFDPSNEATDRLHGGIWMIKRGDDETVYEGPPVREDTSIPVLQCIFPSTFKELVDCPAYVPSEVPCM